MDQVYKSKLAINYKQVRVHVFQWLQSLKCTIVDIKKLTNRMNGTEERISHLGDGTLEITQAEQHRRNRP